MNDESLESVLREAGRSAAKPPDARPDLADRVRQLHQRRRRARRAAATGVMGMLLLGSAVLWRLAPPGRLQTQDASVAGRASRPDETTSLAAEQIERLRAEIARLDAEARRQRYAAERMIRAEDLRNQMITRFQQALQQPDSLELAGIEMEKTAFLLVDHAERRAALAQNDAAENEYRRILRLFPDTRAAQTARRRLEQLSIQKGDL